MKTKKKKPAGQWGGFTTGRGMIVFILPSMRATFTCHQDLPACSVAVMPFHTAFRQHDTPMPMPAFSALPPRSASSLPLTAVACRSCHARCSHVRMCPTGVVIVGGLADSSAMGSCVHCIQSGVYESEA